ncbi:DEKNAAC102288 [Brettanomyces naardenensis]|uniref:DEKNAAC102288 n=1 Tax=Brettanomyces naardenensis TaxID=13370 RepID=A0A448YLF8_BRENA|nr:DEKNAAC102288 [Brettanomyces naardenensis]
MSINSIPMVIVMINAPVMLTVLSKEPVVGVLIMLLVILSLCHNVRLLVLDLAMNIVPVPITVYLGTLH